MIETIHMAVKNVIEKGTILNDTYEIVGEIGAGGGGVVYLARHLRLDTSVVVKRIRDEVKGKVNTRQEADVLKKLKHPYLPRVYDFIERDDGVYTVMDYISGTSLDKLLKEKKKYSSEQLLEWAKQLGEALAYLHGQNPPIIHSDIKPANIIITPEQNVCLIDFNISMALDSTESIPLGISVGYSAPEQYGDMYPVTEAKKGSGTSKAALKPTQKVQTKTENKKEDKTELIDSATVYIPRGSRMDNDATVFTSRGSQADNDATVFTARRSGTDNDATVFTARGNGTDNDATVFTSRGNRNGSDEQRTMLISQSDGENATEYIPSQQIKAEATEKIRMVSKARVDARSDIYSLGCVLYHLATGIVPSRDVTKIIPLSDIEAGVSDGFSFIVDKMMQALPENRYKNGAEYLEAIRNSYKLDRSYIAKKRKRALLIAICAALVLAGGAMTGLFIRQANLKRVAAYEGVLMEADALAESGQYRTAIEKVKSLQEEPLDAECYERELYYLYEAADYEGCLARAEEMIRLQLITADTDAKILADIYYVMANAAYECADDTNAKGYLETAISYYQENALYYRDYSVILAGMGRLEEAQNALNTAEQMGLGEDSLYFANGELHIAKGEKEQALAFFQKTIDTTVDTVLKRRAVLLSTDLLTQDGQWTEAAALLERALNEAGNEEKLSLMEALAECYMRMGDTASDTEDAKAAWTTALGYLEDLLGQGYTSRQLQENIAILREMLGDFNGAEEMLLSMLENYAKDYRIYKRLAFLEANRQQYVGQSARDYSKTNTYYKKAKELYEQSGTEDMEMQMLTQMIQDIKDAGWLR